MWELESLLSALRKGEEPFTAYSQKQRLQQLERLGFIHSIHPAPTAAMARSHSLAQAFVGGEAPDPATRKELEDRLEALAEEEALAAI